MGERIEQIDGIYLREETLDSNLSMVRDRDILVLPLHLRMMSTTRDSLVPNFDYPNIPQPTHVKFKASNFPIMSIKIGSWEKYSRYEGELIAKYYYAKKKIIWEFLDGALKNKIEIQFSDVEAIRATMNETQPETLEILLRKPPKFFRESNPLPKRHTIWHDSSDFTGGQALVYRKHYIKFPPGALDRHYAKLLQSDSRLLDISEKPFPIFDCPYFQSNIFYPSNISIGHGISPQMFPSQADYNLRMVHQNSIHTHGTQSPGMYYQQRNDIIDKTIAPYYESTSSVSNMLAPYYENKSNVSNMLAPYYESTINIPNMLAPYYESTSSVSNMLPMNGQMQSMPSGAPNMLPMNGQMQSMPSGAPNMLPMNGQMQSMSSGAPTMLPMNGQMQSMPNVMFSMQDENVQLSETSDEMDDILRNIEEHLLGDS